MVYCFACGTQNPDGQKFCGDCGKPLHIEQSETHKNNSNGTQSEPITESIDRSVNVHSEENEKKDSEIRNKKGKEIHSKHIEDFMGNDEKIIGKYGWRPRSGIRYATNKRVIYWKKKMIGEDFEDLAYRNISMVKYSSSSRKGLIILGILFLIGFYLFQGNSQSSYMIILGIIFLILGLIMKKIKYRLKGTGISAEDAKIWGFNVPWYSSNKKTEAKKFAKIIRERLAEA